MSCGSQVVLCARTDMKKLTVAFRSILTPHKKEQDKQSTYSVTYRYLRVTIDAVEEQ